MRINSRNNKLIAWAALSLLVVLFLLAFSCTGRKKRLDHRNMIPEKELVSLLKDIYLTDGLLSYPKVKQWFPLADSSSTYFHVIEKHGYTKEALDKTMKFYFIRKPKQLIKIYDQLLGALSEIEAKAEKATMILQVRNENYWPGKENFSFPDPAGKDAADFDIKLDRTGTYSLTFTATLFPDDQTCHPGLIASTYLDEGSGPTQATYLESLKYIKDGLPHTYSLKINVTGNSKLHFAGSLYSYENKPDDWAKHLILSAISIRVKYSA